MVLFFNIRIFSSRSNWKYCKTEPHNLLFLVVITALVALAVYLFRFMGVCALSSILFICQSFPKLMNEEGEDKKKEKPPKRSMYALIMTLCGVHGTISLAIALTLPYF